MYIHTLGYIPQVRVCAMKWEREIQNVSDYERV